MTPARLKCNRTESRPELELNAAKIMPKFRKPIRKTSKSVSRRESRAQKALKQHNLHLYGTETAPSNTEQAFYATRNKLYAQLEAEGFKDLEHFKKRDKDAGPLLRYQSLHNVAKQYNESQAHYYRQWSCYLARNPNKPLNKKQRKILELYSEGVSYRNIVKKLAQIRKSWTTNIKVISHLVNKWKPIMRQWNRTNKDGLDFSPDVGEQF
jgi:hypothetical protein